MQQSQKKSDLILSKDISSMVDISKIDPYVKLDPKTLQYSLSLEGKKNLNKDEIKLVTTAINNSNEVLMQLKDDESLQISLQENSVKFSPKKSQSDGINIAAINTSAYWDYEAFWWGQRIFLSHAFVQDMIAYKNSVFGGVAVTAAILKDLLVYGGVTAWIATAIAGTAGLAAYIIYDRITNNDQGMGVYIDGFWPVVPGLYFASLEIYPAW